MGKSIDNSVANIGLVLGIVCPFAVMMMFLMMTSLHEKTVSKFNPIHEIWLPYFVCGLFFLAPCFILTIIQEIRLNTIKDKIDWNKKSLSILFIFTILYMGIYEILLTKYCSV